ncbi:hypothetical protein D3C80_2183760 [compost metagenome]
MNMLGNLPEIGGIGFGKEEEKKDSQRNKKDQKEIEIADAADHIPEPGQLVLQLNL